MVTDFKKTFWSDAAMVGLILGLAIFAFTIITWALGLRWANNIFIFVAIAVAIYVSGKKRAQKSGDRGFSYGDGVAYTLAIMLFAGFIVGVGEYIMNNFISPEYYQELIDKTMLNAGLDIDSQQMDEAVNMAQKMVKSAPIMILASIFNMVVYGCFISLLAAVFTKKSPNTFSENNDGK